MAEPILVEACHPLDVPTDVAVCPVCKGPLLLEVHEWELPSCRPTIGGLSVFCAREDDEDGCDAWHATYGAWIRVAARTEGWARGRVRVLDPDALLPPCTHRLVIDHHQDPPRWLRSCLLCGESYDRGEVMDRLEGAIRDRWSVASPWTPEERAEDCDG